MRKPITLLLFSLLFFSSGFCQKKFIHLFVALCDNESQGIVPVPKKIGNGNDPDNNLYWGCGYGVRTYFKNSTDWKLISATKNLTPLIMERCIYQHASKNVILIADAYRGKNMRECLNDYFLSISGQDAETIQVTAEGVNIAFPPSSADLVCFAGHDGLMDIPFQTYPSQKRTAKCDAMIFCCYSKEYFTQAVKSAGANPLLWTTGLMSPEAYSIKAAIDGWILNEPGPQIRERAAQAYDKYQHCGMKGARGLFTTGW